MNISLMLFILGIIFISMGYSEQLKPSCSRGVDIKYIPRSIYDEMMESKAYTEKDNESLLA